MKGLAALFLGVIAICTQPSAAANASAAENELETILSQMDSSAAALKTARADFELRTNPATPNAINVRKGHVYFRRQISSVEAMIQIKSPVLLEIHFVDGQLSTYEEGIDEVTKRDIAGHTAEVEAFLSLGYGAGGHALLKNYQVTMAGWETIDAIKTAKLELTPLSPAVRALFSRFVLWIDPQRDVPIQIQGFLPSGDASLLLECPDVKINSKLDDYVFHFHAISSSGYIRPD